MDFATKLAEIHVVGTGGSALTLRASVKWGACIERRKG